MAFLDMRLTEKRRALAEIRRRWRESTPDNPLFLCGNITEAPSGRMSVSNFCLAFEFLHHIKRHEKSQPQRLVAAAEEDEHEEDGGVLQPASTFVNVAYSEADPTRLWAEPTVFPPHFHTAAKRPSRRR